MDVVSICVCFFMVVKKICLQCSDTVFIHAYLGLGDLDMFTKVILEALVWQLSCYILRVLQEKVKQAQLVN